MELYLNAEEQKTRRISFAHCEDEACGFIVEFKYPNCTFFICKEHKGVINADLNGVPAAGISCELHGPMERYDIFKEDNVCPVCENSTLAILSVPNAPKTFAQEVKEQSESLATTVGKVKELSLRADKALQDGNPEVADRLFTEAEEALKIVDGAAEEFEKNHAKEFEALKKITGRLK